MGKFKLKFGQRKPPKHLESSSNTVLMEHMITPLSQEYSKDACYSQVRITILLSLPQSYTQKLSFVDAEWLQFLVTNLSSSHLLIPVGLIRNTLSSAQSKAPPFIHLSKFLNLPKNQKHLFVILFLKLMLQKLLFVPLTTSCNQFSLASFLQNHSLI